MESNIGPIPQEVTAATQDPVRTPAQVGEFVCFHADCRRRFVRKTSLTNHLKAHQNVKSRSIYRTKRARQRAAAAAAELREATSKLMHSAQGHPHGHEPSLSALTGVNRASTLVGCTQDSLTSAAYSTLTSHRRGSMDVTQMPQPAPAPLSPFSSLSGAPHAPGAGVTSVSLASHPAPPPTVAGITAVSSGPGMMLHTQPHFDVGFEMEATSPWGTERPPVCGNVLESNDPNSVESFAPVISYDTPPAPPAPVDALPPNPGYVQVGCDLGAPPPVVRVENPPMATNEYDMFRDQLSYMGQFGHFPDV